MSDQRGTFFGWWVVVVSALGLGVGHAPIIVFSFGVFLKELTLDLHASRAAVSLAFSLQSVATAAILPVIGRAIDRIGPGRVLLAGTATYGLVLISAVVVGKSMAHLRVLFVTPGIVGTCISPVPYGVLVSRWFDRRRGLALGLMASGLGLSAIVMPVVAQRLIPAFGWRGAYAIFGCAALLFPLPAVAWMLRRDHSPVGRASTPVASGVDAAKDMASEGGLEWPSVWRHPTYWLLLSAFFLAGASLHACVVHLPALFTD